MKPRILVCGVLAACAGDDGGDGDGGGEAGPVYVMMTQVYTVDDRSVYFSLTDTLDVDALSLDDAREYAGVANYATIGGKLYVSSGEQPIVTQFDVSPSHAWQEQTSISFAAYPFGDNANFYYHYVVDDDRAILPYEANKRIIWNPAAMTIETDLDDSALAPDVGGMLLEGGGNRAAARFTDGGLITQPFYRHDADWLTTSPDSYIAVYDRTTFAETATLTAPCAGLDVTTVAEDGSRYVSANWTSPIRALYGDGPPPCVVRVTPDGRLDEAFTTDLSALTGGRYAANFRYLQDGLAIANVVHHEELEADFTGAYDPAVEDQLWAGGAVHVWLFDLEANTARPIDGITVPTTLALQSAVIDGRMFLFAVYPDYSSTQIYELTADAVARPMFTVAGDVFKWERLR